MSQADVLLQADTDYDHNVEASSTGRPTLHNDIKVRTSRQTSDPPELFLPSLSSPGPTSPGDTHDGCTPPCPLSG